MSLTSDANQDADATAIAAFDNHGEGGKRGATKSRLTMRARLAAMPADAVLATGEAAIYCGMGASTWERMRMGGETPAAIRLTARTLGYRKRVLDAWLDARTEHRAA